MLSDALRLPYRTADATGTLLVGSVLTGLTGIAVIGWLTLLVVAPRIGVAVTPVVFLLSLVVRGYLLGVVAAGIDGRPAAPSFVQWGSLLRSGGKSALVSAIYFLPAAVLLGLAGGAGIATIIDPPGFEGALQAVAALAILVGGFGTLCYGLGYLYVRGAARAVLAATGSVRAALDVRRVRRLSLSGSYLGGWLVAMGLLTVGPLLLVPLVVVSGLVGLYDPVLTVIGGLVTLLVAVVLLFSLRVSAAWATGRGAAPGLAIDDIEASDDKVTLDPDKLTGPPEVPAAVQVGRTVEPLSGDATGGDTDQPIDFGMAGMLLPDGQQTASEASGVPTNGATPDNEQREPDEHEGRDRTRDESDTGTEISDASDDTEPNDASDTDGSETDDSTEADEFEWGIVEEQ